MVDVVVVAEVAKPEDVDVCRAGTRPVVVLNKADLLGGIALTVAARISALTGAPTVPLGPGCGDIGAVAGPAAAGAALRYRRLSDGLSERGDAARTGDDELTAQLAHG